jgi:hypothetical protein
VHVPERCAALAAGKLGGVTVGEKIELDQCQQLLDAPMYLRF